MSIHRVGSPLCIFSYLQLSQFSRPNIEKIDKIYEIFKCLHSCFTLLHSKFSENKYTIEFFIQHRSLLSKFYVRCTSNQDEAKNEAIVHSQKDTSHTIEHMYAPSYSRNRSPCTLSSQRRHRLWTQLISQIFSRAMGLMTWAVTKVKLWPLVLVLRGEQCTSALECLRLLDACARRSSTFGPWFGGEEAV